MPRKSRYQFDSDETEDEATQMTEQNCKASKVNRAPKSRNLRSKSTRPRKKQTTAHDDTVDMEEFSSMVSKKVKTQSKQATKATVDRNERTCVKNVRGNVEIKRSTPVTSDEENYGKFTLRRQATLKDDDSSPDIESIFNGKVEDQPPPDSPHADKISVDQNEKTKGKVKKVKKEESITVLDTVDVNEIQPEAKSELCAREKVPKLDKSTKDIPDDGTETMDDLLEVLLGSNNVEKRKAPPKRKSMPTKNDPKDTRKKEKQTDTASFIFS